MRKNPNYDKDGNDTPLASPVNGMETRGSEKVLEKHSGPKAGSGTKAQLAGQRMDKEASSTGKGPTVGAAAGHKSRGGDDGMEGGQKALSGATKHLSSQHVEKSGNSWDKDKSVHHRTGRA